MLGVVIFVVMKYKFKIYISKFVFINFQQIKEINWAHTSNLRSDELLCTKKDVIDINSESNAYQIFYLKYDAKYNHSYT